MAFQRPKMDLGVVTAIRAMVIGIEQAALVKYGNEGDFEDTKKILRTALAALEAKYPPCGSADPPLLCEGDEECPDGWQCCGGVCRPYCIR